MTTCAANVTKSCQPGMRHERQDRQLRALPASNHLSYALAWSYDIKVLQAQQPCQPGAYCHAGEHTCFPCMLTCNRNHCLGSITILPLACCTSRMMMIITSDALQPSGRTCAAAGATHPAVRPAKTRQRAHIVLEQILAPIETPTVVRLPEDWTAQVLCNCTISKSLALPVVPLLPGSYGYVKSSRLLTLASAGTDTNYKCVCPSLQPLLALAP